MNGAHALLATLIENDVSVCFANPGTSEMHFVAALDDAPEMRAVLCLFEGVATGAADGYARVTGTPAATLLHLGPGLANGWANLHNARRARVPLLNLVGDHATYHEELDAPLQSNVAALASALDGWYRRSSAPDRLASDAAEAIARAYGPPGAIATLVVPADVSWGELTEVPSNWPRAARAAAPTVDDDAVERALKALRIRRCAIMLGDGALDQETMLLAERVSVATSSRLMMETFTTVMDRGADVVSPERLIYVSEFAIDQLKDTEALILVGAREPVGFFAYPDVPSRLVAPGSEVIELSPPGGDARGALEALVDALQAPNVAMASGPRVAAPDGELTTQTFAAAIGATLPEGVIVADESNTSGVHLFEATRFSPRHRWMTLTGGAIGYGLPVALGAAVASKSRVLALESDGSMMYTLQALWSMAREGLDVTVVGLANRSYAVLEWELRRVGATSTGEASERLLSLENPTLDLAGLARSQGVESVRATNAEELVIALERSYSTPGPTFIEAVLPDGRA
jgi:acetolactate synthase I/II/III large subunit